MGDKPDGNLSIYNSWANSVCRRSVSLQPVRLTELWPFKYIMLLYRLLLSNEGAFFAVVAVCIKKLTLNFIQRQVFSGFFHYVHVMLFMLVNLLKILLFLDIYVPVEHLFLSILPLWFKLYCLLCFSLCWIRNKFFSLNLRQRVSLLLWRPVCFIVKGGSKGHESEWRAGSLRPAETLETNCCWRSNKAALFQRVLAEGGKMLLEVWTFVLFIPLGRWK